MGGSHSVGILEGLRDTRLRRPTCGAIRKRGAPKVGRSLGYLALPGGLCDRGGTCSVHVGVVPAGHQGVLQRDF